MTPDTLWVDLENKFVSDGLSLEASFDIDDFGRNYLLGGLDCIGLTLKPEPVIAAYENELARLVSFLAH